MKLAPEVVLKERNRVFPKVLPNSNFQRNWTLSKFNFFFSFGPTLGPIYPMKEAEIEKNKKIKTLNSGIWLSKNRKIKAVPLLPFKWKIGLLFVLFGAFLGKKRGGVKGKRAQIEISHTLFYQHDSWAYSSQKIFVPALASFAAIGRKGRVFLILSHFLKFGCFSRYHTHLPGKNTSHFPMQNLILHPLIPSLLKSDKQKWRYPTIFFFLSGDFRPIY